MWLHLEIHTRGRQYTFEQELHNLVSKCLFLEYIGYLHRTRRWPCLVGVDNMCRCFYVLQGFRKLDLGCRSKREDPVCVCSRR